MAQSFLIYDFGTNEESAQQARHKIEGWKQAFRLGNKILLKFERGAPAAKEEAAGRDGGAAKSAAEKPAAKKQAGARKKSAWPAPEEAQSAEEPSRIRLFIRLDFSAHEKLSHHRWLDRIPAEEPFHSATGEIIRADDASFAKTAETFDSLE